MKSGTETKLKFKKLQRALGLRLWQARGLLDTLWQFAAVNAPAGDIGKMSDEDIAIGLDWDGDPVKLVNALVAEKWVDAHDEHRLIIHDWPEHCEDTVHMAIARRRGYFADGSTPRLTRFSERERKPIAEFYEANPKPPIKPHVHGTRMETHGERTAMPSLAIPSHALPSQSLRGSAANDVTDDSTGAIPKLKAEDVPLPPALDTTEFREATLAWIKQRRKHRRTVEPDFVAHQYDRLLPLGPTQATACIRLMVDNNYTGLFPEKFTDVGKRPRQIEFGPGLKHDPNYKRPDSL